MKVFTEMMQIITIKCLVVSLGVTGLSLSGMIGCDAYNMRVIRRTNNKSGKISFYPQQRQIFQRPLYASHYKDCHNEDQVRRSTLDLTSRNQIATYNPFDFDEDDNVGDRSKALVTTAADKQALLPSVVSTTLLALGTGCISLLPNEVVNAAETSGISKGDFDPNTFKPVCQASDGFYRFLQKTTQLVVGDDAFIEYGPLIAGGLLRIRLELCVVESFFNEAVTPFIQKNGLTWVLPLHETVETFLAGSVFAVASTFILVGSTKIICVVATYSDFIVGAPCRLIGGFFVDRTLGKPVTLEIGIGPLKAQVIGPPKDTTSAATPDEGLDLSQVTPVQYPILLASGTVKAVGEVTGFVRGVIEGIDLFVGRYLTVIATGYVAFKFVHYKIFPDLFSF